MGLYAYKTIPSDCALVGVTEQDENGNINVVAKTVSVYSYAYKLGRFEDNERWEKQTCGRARTAWRKINMSPEPLGVTSYKGKIEIGDHVFETQGDVVIVEPGEGSRHRYVGEIVTIFRRWA